MKYIKRLLPLALFLLLSTLLCSSSPASAGEGEYTEIWMLAGDGVTHLTFTVPSDYIITVTPERSESLYSMPDEVLSGSTPELLEAFLQSEYMMDCVFSPYLSSDFNATLQAPKNLLNHKAFLELISRDDFLLALDGYAQRILTGAEDMEDKVLTSFGLLLTSENLSVPMETSLDLEDDYPYLREIYCFLNGDPNLASSISTYVDDINL